MKLFLVPEPEPAVAQLELYDGVPPVDAHFQGRAGREGREFDALALDRLTEIGCRVVERRCMLHGYSIDGIVETFNGGKFLVLAHGNIGDSSAKPGLQRTDTIAKVVQRALMLSVRKAPPLVVVTSHLPRPGSAGARQLADLHAVFGFWVVDVVATTTDLDGWRRLEWLFTTTPRPRQPLTAPWRRPTPHEPLLDGGQRFLSGDSITVDTFIEDTI